MYMYIIHCKPHGWQSKDKWILISIYSWTDANYVDFKGDSVPSVILYVIAIRMFGQCECSIDPDSWQIKCNDKCSINVYSNVNSGIQMEPYK